MSVDVFGRKLGRSDGRQGPPGVGYKITAEGQYDVEDKRICNLAAANQLKDAVNLETLQRLIQMEIRSIYDVISRLRSDLDNIDLMMEANRDEIDKKLLDINFQLELLQEKN